MELDKSIVHFKLSQKDKEVAFWSKKYDDALKNLIIIPVMDKEEIEDNEFQIKRFKEKHPLYSVLIELIKTESNNELLKPKVVQNIVDYLGIVYEDGNVIRHKGNFQSKASKTYGEERKSISEDLRMMLYEAFLNNKISAEHLTRNVTALEKIPISTKSILNDNVIIQIDKWELIIKSLLEDNIINKNNEWVGLGPNLSKPPTQLAVFIFILEANKIISYKNQNKTIPKISEYFKLKLSSSRYSQVKKGFQGLEGVNKHMMHFDIYEKLLKYFK